MFSGVKKSEHSLWWESLSQKEQIEVCRKYDIEWYELTKDEVVWMFLRIRYEKAINLIFD